jgi:hypothetical protein
MKKTNILAVVAVMLLLCSVGAAQSQSKKPKFDPEKLLTPAEAKEILGTPVKRAPDTPGVTLQYLEDTERLMSESLSIQIHYGSGAGFARYVQELKKDLNLDPKPVEGIGTKAFYVEGQLVIRHGRHFSVVLFFSKRPDDERLKVLTDVAKTFLPRVPKV